MNDTEFHARVTALLDAVEAQADHWFDQLDLDVGFGLDLDLIV